MMNVLKASKKCERAKIKEDSLQRKIGKETYNLRKRVNQFFIFFKLLNFRIIKVFFVKLQKFKGDNGAFPLIIGALPLLEVFGAFPLILLLKKIPEVLGIFP